MDKKSIVRGIRTNGRSKIQFTKIVYADFMKINFLLDDGKYVYYNASRMKWMSILLTCPFSLFFKRKHCMKNLRNFKLMVIGS